MTDIKTAEQINAAVLGKADLNLSELQTFLSQAIPKPIRAEKPPGCWDLGGLSGSREGVMKAIQADAWCPKADKDWLCSKIAGLPAQFNHVALSAYAHHDKGVWVFDMTLLPSTQLM